MASSDFLALFCSGSLALYIRVAIGSNIDLYQDYPRLIPVIFIFMVVYQLQNLYPGSRIGPVEELRRLTLSTSLTFLIVAVYFFWTQTGINYSRLIYLTAWLFALVLVPFFRAWIRRLAIRAQIWGEPVAVLGSGTETKLLLEQLSTRTEYGFSPYIVVGTPSEDQPGAIQEWLNETYPKLKKMFKEARIETVIMVVEDAPAQIRARLIDENGLGLHHIILIPDVGFFASIAVTPYDFQRVIGLEVQRNLLSRTQRIYKRTIDLLLICFFSPILLPLMALIAIAIKLETPGPVFFLHKRIGVGGKPFMVWKFRTMAANADELLQQVLASSPEMRKEWQENHKLKKDPRITRVGRFLRKTSLDELPQIWNVFIGEMSLIGPRPIVAEEIHYYKNSFLLYQQVLPGLSGLWQVSGRSQTTYDTRVALDEYYIRNWSIWLDILILIRTISVVIKTYGAY